MSALGINAVTGAEIGEIPHLAQSIRDILTTPIGTRVMRRAYGSRLFDLIDSPLTAAQLVQIYAATADALRRWEPRFRLTRVYSSAAKDDLAQGRIEITLEGQYLPSERYVRLEGLVL